MAKKNVFLIISWMHIKYTISILHITIRQILVKIILKNKKKCLMLNVYKNMILILKFEKKNIPVYMGAHMLSNVC